VSDAEIALSGIVVGAVASGGIQAAFARSTRQREGRTAARLLYQQLHSAHWAIEDLRERRDWSLMITDWTVYGAAWERHGLALMQFLATRSAARVATAFECLGTVARTRVRDELEPPSGPGQPPNFDPGDVLLADYADAVERAKMIALRASFRWWEFKARHILETANERQHVEATKARYRSRGIPGSD
jgi:hypothetical protein